MARNSADSEKPCWITRLLTEVYRRRVGKALGAYLIMSWGIIEVSSTVFPLLRFPAWTASAVVVLLLALLPLVAILAWTFDLTHAGIRRANPLAPGELYPLRFGRAAAFGIVVLALLLGGWAFLSKRKVAARLDMRAVAILPFHLSAEQDLGYLGEGMVDLLATKLSSDAGLRAVSPRTTIKAWQALIGSTGTADERDALAIARRLGAGQFVSGSIVGNTEQFSITAALFSAVTGGERVHVTVSGPDDSLLVMVDHLAAELLSRNADERFERLAQLTTTSVEAVKLYLDGRAAYRNSDFTRAQQLLEQAMAVDSTFALAGLLHHGVSVWVAGSQAGFRLAWAHRDRLSARDRALVEVINDDIGNEPLMQVLRGIERLAETAPEDAEAVFMLADNYYHFGAAVGMLDAEERALALMQRSLELDSTFLPALSHMFEFDAVLADQRLVRDYSRRYLEAQRRNPSGEIALARRWQIAHALADSATLRELSSALDTTATGFVEMAAFRGLLPLEDARRVLAARTGAALTAPARAEALLAEANFAAWTGRPTAAARLAQEVLRADPNSHVALRMLVDAAIWYEGDTLAARIAARELDRLLATQAGSTPALVVHRGHCALASWDLAHGDIAAARRRFEHIRAAVDAGEFKPYSSVSACAAWLAAELANAARSPDAARLLARLDSLLRDGTFTIFFALERGNCVSMRLHQERGEHEAALAAARRQIVARYPPVDRTVQLLGQARSAARLGHANEAIRAYQRYLLIRADPEAGTRAEAVVNAARAELVRLLDDTSPR